MSEFDQNFSPGISQEPTVRNEKMYIIIIYSKSFSLILKVVPGTLSGGIHSDSQARTYK